MASNPVSLYDRLMAVKPDGLSRNAWATGAGLNRNVFNDILRRGAADRDTIERLLAHIGLTEAQFEGSTPTVRSEVRPADIDALHEPARMYRPDERPPAPLPLVGTAHGGEYGDLDADIELTELHMSEVVEFLPRPRALANDDKAYAVTIVGDSMAPRFKPGERVAVSPRAPIAIGDDVIIQLRGADGNGEDDRVKMVLIKELVRRTADHVELLQHRPERVFRVDRRRVAAMHKVSGNFF